MTLDPSIFNLSLDALLPPDEADPATERLPDAALAQFEDMGLRRTTIEDIAKRAGVDRVTVYRRLGSKDDVIQSRLGTAMSRCDTT